MAEWLVCSLPVLQSLISFFKSKELQTGQNVGADIFPCSCSATISPSSSIWLVGLIPQADFWACCLQWDPTPHHFIVVKYWSFILKWNKQPWALFRTSREDLSWSGGALWLHVLAHLSRLGGEFISPALGTQGRVCCPLSHIHASVCCVMITHTPLSDRGLNSFTPSSVLPCSFLDLFLLLLIVAFFFGNADLKVDGFIYLLTITVN